MNWIEATKNKRATHDSKEIDGEKSSNGAAQSVYRTEWEKKSPQYNGYDATCQAIIPGLPIRN